MAKKWFEIPAVSLLMLVLAILSTYPLILYFDGGMPYGPVEGETFLNRTGDQFQLLYWFWLVKENFIGAVPFDTNPFEFNMLIPHETSGLNTIPLAFLYMLFSPLGDIAAYNCLIFSSYVLAGVFMYLLAYQYSGSRTGALLAAIIFTFAPSRVKGFVGGHGYGFLYFCYPFILYFLEKGIRSKKIRYGVLSGIGLMGLAMLEPHLIYYLCVFLGLYIPVRVLTLFPVCQSASGNSRIFFQRAFSLSERYALLVAWAAGAGAVLYTQTLFSCRDNDPFVSPFFWWVFSLYPFIPVLFSLCFAAIYQRVSPLSFRESLSVEAASLFPLLVLFLISGLLCLYKPVDTTFLVVSAILLLIIAKIVLLRSYLLSMLKVLGEGIWREKRKIFPILPLIFSMAAVVYWIAGTKVSKIENTIAGGGRTLNDVKLFSSHLADLFSSTSLIYVGIVPAVLCGWLLISLLFSTVLNKQREKFGREKELIILFYVLIAFCCFILALGLAFGKSSLYILFYNYFPFFNYPRVSDRIIIMVLFAMAILSGFVVRKIQRCYSGRMSMIVVSCLVLLAAGFQLKDYNVLKPMAIIVVDSGQSIYKYVKKNIGDGLLLEIPLWPGDSHQSSLYQHYVMLDSVPRLNGYSPLVLKDYIDTVFEPLAPINQGRFDREQYELLLELDVKFITVHDNRDVFLHKVSPFVPLTTVRRLKNSPYLEFVDIENKMFFKDREKKNDDLYLFRVKDPADVDESMLPAWYEMPYFYDVNHRLHKQTGVIVEDKSIGRRVFQATAFKEGHGFLVYGPYDIYSPGDYRCYYTIYTDAEPEDKVARLEVSSLTVDDEQVVLAQKDLKGKDGNRTYRKEYIDFSIEKNTKLEFRVFFYGKGQVRVEKIAVNKIGNDAPLSFLKAEMMVGDTGQLEVEEDAITGKIIEVIPGKSKKGDMVFGPNRIYSKGRYKAQFLLRMKASKKIKKNDIVAVISVTEGQNLKVFSKLKVKALDLSTSDFRRVEVDFDLKRDEDLSFHVRFTGKAGLQLDGIEIISQ
jgi:hypothetical protein